MKNEVSNITEENPTVNKTSRIASHKKGDGLLIIAKVRSIQIADGRIIPAYRIFMDQKPYLPNSLRLSILI